MIKFQNVIRKHHYLQNSKVNLDSNVFETFVLYFVTEELD